MAVINSGDPVSTLRSALDAYTKVQETMVAEAAKLKDSAPAAPDGSGGNREGGAESAVPAGYQP